MARTTDPEGEDNVVKLPPKEESWDPFNVEALKALGRGEETTVEKVLLAVPVRKPRKGEFFRVHADPAMSITTKLYRSDDGENFLVNPAVLDVFGRQIVRVILYYCVGRYGDVFLWPVRVPDEGERDNSYWWALDFEYRAPPGCNPEVVCLVAHDVVGGRRLRLWGDELVRGKPPFRTDESALFVAYFASAEMGCFLSLGWPLPRYLLDLYPEFRRLKNWPVRASGLLDACRSFGIATMTAEEKHASRERILAGPPFTSDERAAILRYCEADVVLLRKLLRRMLPEITGEPKGFGQALLRGRYMQAVARMERCGVPVDVELYTAIRSHWGEIKHRLISEVDERYGVFLGETFKLDRFQALVDRLRLGWPRTPTGRLATDENTFKSMARRHPELRELHELRVTLGQMRDFALPAGPDGRNRCLLSPFGTKTGRNAPSSTRFVFGPATWLRSLIRAEPGKGLAYLDWSAEEIAIAAVLSGDQRLLEIVREGDPYLGFARLAGLAPADATKDTHPAIRELCKMLFLGVGYGMQEPTLAGHLNCGIPEARQLLRLYRETFPRLTAWTEAQCDQAMLTGSVSTVFGWRLLVSGEVKPTTLRNFPIQSAGAELLRLAASLATEQGIAVAAPVHDALLIESDVASLDTALARTRAAMDEASRAVLDGLAVKVDVKVILYPHRYSDKRGEALFTRVYRLLGEITGRVAYAG